MSAAQTKAKKPAAKPKAVKSKAAGKTTSHPPFADIIRECIAETGDRTGVSRPTIKKYIEDKYRMEVTASVISNINRSIAYGAEKGTFVLPKGPSGKVKLAPKNRTSDSAKENAKPKKPSAPAKKAVVSKPKPAAKPVKKATTTKKTTKAAVKKTSTKRAPAKKSITGSTKTKTASKAKSPAKKRTSAAAPASKRKATSSAKPASKAASAKPVSKK